MFQKIFRPNKVRLDNDSALFTYRKESEAIELELDYSVLAELGLVLDKPIALLITFTKIPEEDMEVNSFEVTVPKSKYAKIWYLFVQGVRKETTEYPDTDYPSRAVWIVRGRGSSVVPHQSIHATLHFDERPDIKDRDCFIIKIEEYVEEES